MNLRINQPSYPIPNPLQKPIVQDKKEFQSVLSEKKLNDLKISNHAQKRLEQRGLHLEENDYTQLNSAVDELEEKGSKNSLLLYKDLALIASIHNRTIITALDRDEVDTITNIDSTKFVKTQGLDRKEASSTDRLM
ncbi:TIGR02530 family flagellar biosynthesis protein [Jeotgalibaca ciconiae]|uniref:TIGR02530 family flagellar biosynthesis protein n=1 Tax=Jeotgalibaca ciconiae TaxID=2496265 RepID=UPI001D1317CD|nr:TIGR02530 family flagellar biosynthesis protein [Jeotgalibaca ciconiae]